MIKVSIIVPVYNVEPYLRKALDSCINQTLKDIEIICIDDCSTDNSLSILEEYVNNDSRFVLIKQEVNQGQGIARNMAIEKAKGKYIMFLDPDDWFELDACEVMYNAAEENNAKVVQSTYIEHLMDGTNKIADCFYDYSQKNNIEILPNTFVDTMKLPNTTFRTFRLLTCGKIHLLEHIKSNNIAFAPYRKAEDQPWSIDIKLSTPIFYIDKPTYNYLIRSDSACTYQTLYEEIIESVRQVVNKYPEDKNITDKFNEYVAWRYYLKYKGKYFLPYFCLKHIKVMNLEQWILFFKKIKIMQKLFSVKNEVQKRNYNKKHKVVTILGIKFKFKVPTKI